MAYREKNGDFDSVDDLIKVGVPRATIARLREFLTAVDVEAFFNSRPNGAPAGGTGYGPDGTRTAVVAGADGVIGPARASVTVAATDLFNRAKAGEEIDVAMYGASPSAPEFVALLAAAKRGAVVRVVLENDFTAPAAAALKALAAQGYPVDVRIQKAKTMHEKFGVVGNDVFFGSANFSESSSTKHSENRDHREEPRGDGRGVQGPLRGNLGEIGAGLTPAREAVFPASSALDSAHLRGHKAPSSPFPRSQRMKRIASLCLAVAVSATGALADEGMWTFNNFPAAKVKAKYGFEPTKDWLDNLRLSSVRIAGRLLGLDRLGATAW